MVETYKLVAGSEGQYEVVLTRSQAEHMLSLWGEQYDINDCTTESPISSPSGYSTIHLVSQPETQEEVASHAVYATM